MLAAVPDASLLPPPPACPPIEPACVPPGEPRDVAFERLSHMHAEPAAGGLALTWYWSDGAWFSWADADGQRLGEPVFLSPNGILPRASWNGVEAAVVWTEQDAASDRKQLGFLRVGGDGAVIEGSRVTLAGGSLGFGQHAHVAWNAAAAEWGVLWEDHETLTVNLTRFDAAGQPIANGELLLSEPETIAQLAGVGNQLIQVGHEWVVVFTEALPGRVKLARIDERGELTRVVTLAEGRENPLRPSVAGTCDALAVAWFDYVGGIMRVNVVRTDHDGTPFPGEEFLVERPDAHVANPNMLSDGAGFQLVYNLIDLGLTNTTAEVIAIPLHGGPAEPRPIEATDQVGLPHAAWDECRLVVTYVDPQSTGHIYFAQ
jgi:hypothetical protein